MTKSGEADPKHHCCWLALGCDFDIFTCLAFACDQAAALPAQHYHITSTL